MKKVILMAAVAMLFVGTAAAQGKVTKTNSNTTVNANATATTVSNQNNSNANGVKANPTNFRGNKGVNNNAKADCNNQGKPCSHANDCKKPCNNNKGNNKGPKTDATPTMTTTVGK